MEQEELEENDEAISNTQCTDQLTTCKGTAVTSEAAAASRDQSNVEEEEAADKLMELPTKPNSAGVAADLLLLFLDKILCKYFVFFMSLRCE